jgi:cytidylate kinase
MIVTLSGLPGSGKTSVAKDLASRYGFVVISAGEQFRKLARERGVSLEEFGRIAESDPSIDLMIDSRQKELAKAHKMALVEGRLAGRTIDADLKIWLKAPLEVRAERISRREGIPVSQALEETRMREASEAMRYKAFYNIDQNDLACYDLIIDTRLWDARGVVGIISAAIEGLGKK